MPHLSPFVRSGNHLYLSGQLGFDDERRLANDIGSQTCQCLANIAQTLAAEGLSLRNVIKATIFLTRAADFPAFDTAYAVMFGDNRPARSTVITGLAILGAFIEIEVIAEVERSG
jgi:2-iminobutanoate/2-iminopropanoate deaminase